jgi:hypothetical protein
MRDGDKADLYRLVLRWLSNDGWSDEEYVKDCIQSAHLGRPDGVLVTSENQWMLRQYRNAVSPSADQLIEEARKFTEVQDVA